MWPLPFLASAFPPPPADLRNVAELGWAGQEKESSRKPHCTLMGFLLRTQIAGSEQGNFSPSPASDCSHFYCATSHWGYGLVEWSLEAG